MRLYTYLRALLKREDGQDLIEYALVVALLSLGATAGMHSVASRIGSTYSSLGTSIGTYISNGNSGNGNNGNCNGNGNNGNGNNGNGNNGNGNGNNGNGNGNHGNHGG
jgi:Flp pilus assembly pilin Flp